MELGQLEGDEQKNTRWLDLLCYALFCYDRYARPPPVEAMGR